MEENHDGTGSKPAEKFIQIDSIYIDLLSSDDKFDGQKCEPFSIRGYVSDMRQKDPKICWPFSDTDHDDRKLDEHILSVPPVYDTSFDLQRGKGHWQKCSDHKVAEGFIFYSCRNLGTFSSAAPKAMKRDVIDGRTMIDSPSILCCQPSSFDEKEKKLKLADNSFVGLISQSEPGVASHEVTKIAPVRENLILKVTEAGEQTSADHLNGQLTLAVSENDNTVDVNRAHHAVEFQENVDVSMDSNENTISSSESAEIIGNGPRHCHLGKLHRRRAPKIRLLTELLGGNMKATHVQSSPSNGTSETSVEADVRYALKCQVTMEENTRLSDHKRERRLRRNGKCRHEEIPSSSSVDKQVQTWRGEIENSVASLGTENALSARKKTMKGLWSSRKMDGNNSLKKKKLRKFPDVDPDSVSLMPSEVKDQCAIQAITEYGNNKEALDSAAVITRPNEFSSKTPHSISLNTMESKSIMSKNPNSSKDSPADLFSWNNGIIRKDSVTRKDVEAMKSRTVANTFQYENYKNNERELQLSLHNYSNPQRSHQGIYRQEENELPTFLPAKDNTSRVRKFTRDDFERSYHGDPNHTVYKASDNFYGGADSMLNGKMANLRMHLSRRNVDPHTDTSWWQLQKQDKYSGSNGKRTIEAEEPLSLKKKQINQRVDLTSDSGTSDDIPMEIVELMAKNQYERRLPDAENNEHVSETGSFSRPVQVNNYGDKYRNGRGLLQKPENLKQKAQARNGVNAANRARKVGETRKRKSADFFINSGEPHGNANHLQLNQLLRHNASIHYQEEPPKGIQYSSIGSKRQSCTEISKHNGMVESGPYNSKVQSSEGYIDCLPVSGHNLEAARIWSSSSSMPNHLPNGFHRFPADSTGKEKVPSPRPLQMGNAMAQNYHNHHPTNNYETYSQKSAESSFRPHPNGVELHENQIGGSLELYSNETISAMHLLSLMDAGMRSNAPMTAGGMHKSSKRPPIPRPLKGKEFSGMNIFNKTIQDINQFSSAFHDGVRTSAATSSASTFQHSSGFGIGANYSGQAVVKSQNRAKMKCLDPSMWSKDQKLLKSQFRTNGLGTDGRTFPDNGIQKYVVDGYNPEAFVLSPHMKKQSEEYKFVAHTRTLQNQKRTYETEICRVNKNPADFTLPEAGNIYMIGAEDFNFGRTLHLKHISSSIYFNDRYTNR